MNLISEDIDAYCVNHSIGDSQILTDLYQYTYETESAPQMMCGNMVGGILQLLIDYLFQFYIQPNHLNINLLKSITTDSM